MKWSIFLVAVLATLLAATSYAGGLLGEGDVNYSPTPQYQVAPPAQPVSYQPAYGYAQPGYGYTGGYDPYGPQTYFPWNSSRCYNCMGVWAGYGCHEFKGPKQGGACGGGCRGGKFGGHGCQQGCAPSGEGCTADGCTANGCTAVQLESAPLESAPADQPVEPPAPPMPSQEKSASRSTVWPQASALFPVLNN
ncbi:MAG: hypothetical protein OES79_02900 [Planctomycetota bacterium]|nr:hypothetical protein [Planctomycetota bacterium]